MDLNYLRRLVKIFDDSKTQELEIEEDGIRIYFSKTAPNQAPVQYSMQMPAAQPAPQVIDLPSHVSSATAPSHVEMPAAPKEDSDLHILKSPIIGTFYRSASPTTAPYVEIGSRVAQGQTLCIVEAMKLMNEIESDVNGTVVKIMIENGKPVEYGQPLFLIKAD